MNAKELFKTLVISNVLDVSFIKKDGSIRYMKCTLRSDIIPSYEWKTSRDKDSTNVIVWDIEASDWRTINVNTLQSVEVVSNVDVPKEDDINGPWGYELIVNAKECNQYDISSPETIERFLAALVDTIDMIAYGKPMLSLFGVGNKRGYTAIQLIETSNISCHFSEDTRNAYFNVFSCKKFDPEAVLDCINHWFIPENINARLIERDADSEMINDQFFTR